MANTFRPYILAFVIIGLFMLSLLNFAVNLQVENNANQTLTSDPTVSNLTGRLENDLDNFKTTADEQRTAFETENPLLAFGELIFNSITSVGKVIGSVGTTFYGIIGEIALAIGVPAIVINIVGAIIVISIVLFAWRLYRTGE